MSQYLIRILYTKNTYISMLYIGKQKEIQRNEVLKSLSRFNGHHLKVI